MTLQNILDAEPRVSGDEALVLALVVDASVRDNAKIVRVTKETRGSA
jgi:hypothetical protein